MNDNIELIVTNAKQEINGSKTEQVLDQIVNNYLGANGLLPRSKRSVESLPKQFQHSRIRAVDNAIRKLERMVDKQRKEIKFRNNVKR